VKDIIATRNISFDVTDMKQARKVQPCKQRGNWRVSETGIEEQ
jgi:hypothetical protein